MAFTHWSCPAQYDRIMRNHIFGFGSGAREVAGRRIDWGPPASAAALRAERWRVKHCVESVRRDCKLKGFSQRRMDETWLRWKESEA